MGGYFFQPADGGLFILGNSQLRGPYQQVAKRNLRIDGYKHILENARKWDGGGHFCTSTVWRELF